MGESLKSQQAVISQKLSIKLFLTKFSGSYELSQSEKNYVHFTRQKIELNSYCALPSPSSQAAMTASEVSIFLLLVWQTLPTTLAVVWAIF